MSLSPFLVGAVCGIVATLVAVCWLHPSKPPNPEPRPSENPTDDQLEMIYRNVKRLLNHLRTVHRRVGNPYLSPYIMRQNVNQCLDVLSDLMAQLVSLSRVSDNPEIRKKWDSLSETIEQMDTYLLADSDDPLDGMPTIQGHSDDGNRRRLN